ncbi:MAG: 5'/3'-nucleotidase SurE [Chitinophagaceae bacterium]|nr:MAG: 5'/3'-nucleotidase SurE [Chitinophagaceae bacterium]
MPKKKPLILVTNDDGITAPGIRALIDAMSEIGDVVVVAPDKPQSGMGHAITLNDPLRIEKVDIFKNVKAAYQCSGTPVDCVKLAKDKILKGNPDLCVSGVNHGSNSSINVIYSGTMSAAVEASIEGIKAVGFSLLDYSFEADFEGSKKYAKLIAENMLKAGIPDGTLLNVNIPAIPANEIKGMKVVRQAVAKWEEDYDERQDPRGKNYFWLSGKFVNYDKGKDTDEWALENNYVSIVPVQFDLTAHHTIRYINENWNINES